MLFFWALRDLNFHLLLGRISAKRGEGGGGGGGRGGYFPYFWGGGQKKEFVEVCLLIQSLFTVCLLTSKIYEPTVKLL